MSRALPSALPAERSILGGLLLQPRAFPDAAEHVRAEDFHHPAHQAIFEAIAELDALSLPIDPITVAERLRVTERVDRLRGVGGSAYLAELQCEVVTVENLGYHARMVANKATVRRLIEAAQEIAAKGYGDYGDFAEFVEGAERQILAVAARHQRGSAYRPIGQAIREEMRAIGKRADDDREVTGIPTGYRQLDLATTGLHPQQMIIVAARPSMGKTAFALNILRHAGEAHGVPSLFFSLETSQALLARRMLAADAAVNGRRLGSGKLLGEHWVRLHASEARMHDLPVCVNDTGGISLGALRSQARRWRAKEGKGPHAIIGVDYLQLVTLEASSKGRRRDPNREQEVSEISRGLKALTKELDATLLILSQLNRSVEQRPDKRPRMSDLRDSGQIEQDADVIAFIYRDEVYDKQSPDKGIAEIILGKNKDGPTMTVRLGFEPQFVRFRNLAADAEGGEHAA